MLVRTERPGDEERIAAVHRGAFGKDEEARIVDALRTSAEYLPELSLVAEVDGEIVGHVVLSRGGLDGRPAVALGPIGVEPGYQRRGIGSTLMRVAIARAQELGEDVIVLLGHPWYYPRFGFVPASRLGIEFGEDLPEEVFMALELRPGGARGGGTFTYPSAFGAPVD